MLNRLKAWARRSLENPSTPIANLFFGPNTLAGVSLDERDCLSHLPIFAAINRIASDIALFDPQVYEVSETGRTVSYKHKLNYLLTTTPDGEKPADRWRQACVGHVLSWGNAYSEIEFDGDFQPAGFHLLDPSRMRVVRLTSGQVVYRYMSENQGEVPLPPWKVLHFAGLGFDGLVGYSPIAMARETLAIGRAADLYGAGFFGNAARPSGMLSHPGVLGDNAKKNLRESFTAMHGGPTNTGRILVGEEGLTWTQFSLPPDEAQFIETRKMGVEDVARLYGIPAHKIGGAPPTGSVEEQNIDYLQSTLLGICNMIEGEIALKCLNRPTERGRYEVSHDFKKLLKANAAARAQYNATAIQWGWATRNRVAQDEGYAPYVGGELPLLPLNMMQIGPDGKAIPNPTPPAPATPTTEGTGSSSTDAIRELSGLAKALIEDRSRGRRRR